VVELSEAVHDCVATLTNTELGASLGRQIDPPVHRWRRMIAHSIEARFYCMVNFLHRLLLQRGPNNGLTKQTVCHVPANAGEAATGTPGLETLAKRMGAPRGIARRTRRFRSEPGRLSMVLGTRLLNRLAAASLALGCGSLPSDALADWVEAERRNEPEKTPLEAVSTAGHLAAGARAAVTAFWSKSHEAGETFVTQLASGDSAALRIAAAAALGQVLELASPMERIEIVCRWTVAEDACQRLSVARALALPIQAFVTDLAIGVLSRDANAEVRVAAAHAARTHARVDPRGFAQILAELASDPVPSVRAAAREASPPPLA
jgi:hypothetical protein